MCYACVSVENVISWACKDSSKKNLVCLWYQSNLKLVCESDKKLTFKEKSFESFCSENVNKDSELQPFSVWNWKGCLKRILRNGYGCFTQSKRRRTTSPSLTDTVHPGSKLQTFHQGPAVFSACRWLNPNWQRSRSKLRPACLLLWATTPTTVLSSNPPSPPIGGGPAWITKNSIRGTHKIIHLYLFLRPWTAHLGLLTVISCGLGESVCNLGNSSLLLQHYFFTKYLTFALFRWFSMGCGRLAAYTTVPTFAGLHAPYLDSVGILSGEPAVDQLYLATATCRQNFVCTVRRCCVRIICLDAWPTCLSTEPRQLVVLDK